MTQVRFSDSSQVELIRGCINLCSSATLFVSKLRTRISESLLDDMVVLRSHFLAEKRAKEQAQKKTKEKRKRTSE